MPDWTPLKAGPDFKGLLRRRQMQLDDPTYFEALNNIDAYGDTLAKRSGSQIVNGYGSFLTVAGNAGDTFLSLNDGSGFVVGQPVTLGGTDTYTVTSTSYAGIGINPALRYAWPQNAQVLQTFPAPAPIQTLFQAVYRNGDKVLWAACDATPLKVIKGAAPAQVTTPPQSFSTLTGTVTTTGATLGWASGLGVGSWISISGVPYMVEIQSFTPINPVEAVVTWAPPLATAPVPGTIYGGILGLHTSSATPPPEFVQYGNYTYMVGGYQNDGAGHGWPTIPLAIRQTQSPPGSGQIPVGASLYYNRIGLQPPTLLPLTGGTAPGTGWPTGYTGPVSGLYGYRVRYYNSTTGQESEGSPEVQVNFNPPTAGTEAVTITVPGSADPQCDQLRLYRTTVNGGGAWYRVPVVKIGDGTGSPVTTIPNPGLGNSTTIVDFATDEVIVASNQMRDLMDNVIPPTISVLAIWGQANRLIGIDRVQNAVLFSDQPDLLTGRLKGESWPVNNSIFVSYDDGDALTGVAAFFDSVLIFKQHSVWRLTGIPPSIRIQPIAFRQDQTATGVMSQRQIVIDHDDVIFRGIDAIYELNRYIGQSEGFKSQRLSLPIDEVVQQGCDTTQETPVSHGVYHRYKRQVRFWETTHRAIVLQFEASTEGDPFGWMVWTLQMPNAMALPLGGPQCSCIARYDPNVFRGNTTSTNAPVDAANFVATDGGLVVQLDIGQADFGCQPYEVLFAPIRLSPAGRGIPARGRALDLQVQQINAATPQIEVVTDWFTPTDPTDPTTAAVITQIPFLDGQTTMYPDQIDLIGVPLPAYDTVGTLLIAPGHHHEILFREQSLTSYYRILGWTYWFQPLSQQAVWRRYMQPNPPQIVLLPNP